MGQAQGRHASSRKPKCSASWLSKAGRYSTFLGGGSTDDGFAITLDEAGNAYLAGQTYSSDFPTTPGAYDTGHNGDSDVFVTRLLLEAEGLYLPVVSR